MIFVLTLKPPPIFTSKLWIGCVSLASPDEPSLIVSLFHTRL